MNCVVIIPAGGRGSRFGSTIPKQYQPLRGRPVLAHTIDRFIGNELVERLVVATPPDDRHWDELVREEPWGDRVTRVDGGETRQASVFNALKESGAEGDDLVAVHDGVRPFFSAALLRQLLDVAAEYGAAIPGLPPGDTIHQVDEEGFVSGTLDRRSLRAVQTPQCFSASVLLEGYAAADGIEPATDEAMLVGRAGHRVMLVPGEASNIKITLPSDLTRAEENYDEWMRR